MQQASTHTETQLQTYERFPFDVIRMTGNDSVDFLQRITTNDFGKFKTGEIQKTLVITEKGRVIDAVWVLHRGSDLLMLCSYAMGNDVISWLTKFIIMEDITLENVTTKFRVDVSFSSGFSQEHCYATDFFGHAMWLSMSETADAAVLFPDRSFESWRIEHGVPVTKKELTQEYNPLELNLWDWISFTKGCYIGQEVIARLDTYQKVQRALCVISFSDKVSEGDEIADDELNSLGKITSAVDGIGLAIIRSKYAQPLMKFRTVKNTEIRIVKVFQKEDYGRN
jgi:folate-binding protein YgfZ